MPVHEVPTIVIEPQGNARSTERRTAERTSPMASRQSANVAHFYPEVGAADFSHVDGTVDFYTNIHSSIDR